MLHKHVESFCQQFQLDLNMLGIVLSQGHRNLIVVAANSPFVQKAVVNTVVKANVPFVVNDVVDLHSDYGGIGSYLHSLLDAHKSSHEGVGVFDYANVVNRLPLNTLSEEINNNRDVFTVVFNSTIMIVPPKLLDSIMRCATDFWSCVELCIYVASWIQNPRDLPIWYYEYRTDNQTIMNYRELSGEDRSIVLAVRDNILKLDIFSSVVANEVMLDLSNIKKISYMQYLDLFVLAVYKIAKSRVPTREHAIKYNYMASILADTANDYSNAVILKIVGDYMYDCGDYPTALRYFQTSLQISDTIIGDLGERLRYLTTANVTTCKYLVGHLTQEELLSRLIGINTEFSFVETPTNLFKSLTELLLCEDTYVERKDMMSFFKNTFQSDPAAYAAIRWCDDLVYWERFLLGTLSQKYFESKISRTKGDVLRYAYKTVYAFCVGDVNSMKMYYKQFKRIARQYEWFSVLKVMQTVMENIQFILNYCEDGDKLMSTDNTE